MRKLTRSFNKAAISFLELDLNDDHIKTFRKEFINLTMLYVKLIDLLEIFVKLSKTDHENDEEEYSEKIDWVQTQYEVVKKKYQNVERKDSKNLN